MMIIGNVERSYEFAVEVPGRGYLDGGIHPSGLALIAKPEYGIPDIESADKLLESARRCYASMGVPEVAATLLVVAREIITTRTDWTPEATQEQRNAADLKARIAALEKT